ncbi:MAG: GNAT family N-acetyltransferase [Clostridium lundense]|nr:GNAT family N-acetyltransferase [Clostridium lundense]
MDIIRVDKNSAKEIAPLVADFRVTLSSFRGIDSKPDIDSGTEEIMDFLNNGWPVFSAVDGNVFAGYIVCKIEEPCLWVEQLYVREAYRRKGIASLLFGKAEELAKSMGEDTVFNFVHPNNEGIVGFLRSKGYTVLNMIEIRKPYRGEELTTTISVGDNAFDY